MSDPVAIGTFLAALRRAEGATQQEIADRLGVSNRTLSAWERGIAMPDIVMIPALADLYGVTSDEILRGARAGQQPAPPSLEEEEEDDLRPEPRTMKKRLSRFGSQTCILLGVACAGMILFFLGYRFILLEQLGTSVYTSWSWWLIPLLLGAVTLVISAGVFAACFRSAALFAFPEEEEEEIPGFCAFSLELRRRASLCAFLAAGVFLAATVAALWVCVPRLQTLLWEDPTLNQAGSLTARGIALTAPLWLPGLGAAAWGMVINRMALSRWGKPRTEEEQREADRKNVRLSLFALIPVAVAAVVTAVFSGWQPETRQVIWSSSSRAEFTSYMESVEIDYDKMFFVRGDYLLPDDYTLPPDGVTFDFKLTSWSLRAWMTEEYVQDLGNGFLLDFSGTGCQIMTYNWMQDRDGEKVRMVIAHYNVEEIIVGEAGFPVFNLRFHPDLAPALPTPGRYGRSTGYAFEMDKEAVAVVVREVYDYSPPALCVGVLVTAGVAAILGISVVIRQAAVMERACWMSRSARRRERKKSAREDQERPRTNAAATTPKPGKGGSKNAKPGASAGVLSESGAGASAGVSTESGAGASAGVSTESGAGASAGVPTETGAGASAGVPTESGASASAGVLSESGAGASAGVPTETGAGASAGVPTESGAGASEGVPTEPGQEGR